MGGGEGIKILKVSTDFFFLKKSLIIKSTLENILLEYKTFFIF